MIRCVRLWTGKDKESHFEEGWLDLPKGERGDMLSDTVKVQSISFRETNAGGSFSWHEAPARQFVITLSGTLEFETRSGATFTIHPGDILLAEDTTGEGHRWRLTDQQPWRRVYVIFAADAQPPFISAKPSA
ncbi:cupin domain-containing protein [Bordetella trematum]|uniref:cupin domain-containing protein n=1 Tax=Bordetella trematum TaxID=123899 RepID=UPI00052E7835|nr:cupin domain-containing protein [Bordetella trematum]